MFGSKPAEAKNATYACKAYTLLLLLTRLTRRRNTKVHLLPGTEQNEFLELLRSPVYNRNALTIIDSLSLSFQKAFFGNSSALRYHSLFKCLYSLYKSWSMWWLQSHHGTPTPTISLKTTDFQTLLFFFLLCYLMDTWIIVCLQQWSQLTLRY